MEVYSTVNRIVRAAVQRHIGSPETSWITPIERRLEELSRRKDKIEKRINCTVFLLAACIFMIGVLICASSLSSFIRASPLTISSIRLLIYGCSVLFVGQSGVVFVLNYQFELLSREITNVRYWSEINQSANRQLSLDGAGGRNASQVRQNIQSGPLGPIIQIVQRFANVPNTSNSQNVLADSNLQNDVMNIFRIRNLLHYIPSTPKNKYWSISSERDNCGILMKQPPSQCSSYGRNFSEDQISRKNVLKRKGNTILGRREDFVKSTSIWSDDKLPNLLDVSSSEEVGKERSDQSVKNCQLPTSLILRQDNLSEAILDDANLEETILGQETSSRDNRQSSLTDNVCIEEVSNRSLDQSVRSKHLSSYTNLQAKDEDEYEHLLNIAKSIWHPTETAAYEGPDPLSETEQIATSEFESLGTSCLVDEMLKYVSPDVSLSSTDSESSDFLNINSDPDVLPVNMNMDTENQNLNSSASNAFTPTPSICTSRRKRTLQRT